jgi:hypothetical protein
MSVEPRLAAIVSANRKKQVEFAIKLCRQQLRLCDMRHEQDHARILARLEANLLKQKELEC